MEPKQHTEVLKKIDYEQEWQQRQEKEKQALVWLRKQDLLVLMATIGPKIENVQQLTKPLLPPKFTEKHTFRTFSCNANLSIRPAREIKELYDKQFLTAKDLKEMDPSATLCVTLYNINKRLQPYIKSQRMQGDYITTTFNPDATLDEESVYNLFKLISNKICVERLNNID